MSKLIETAREIKANFGIEKLEQAGYKRNRKEYEFIVTYPSIPALSAVSQEKIFSGKPKEREVQFYVHIPFCTGTCTYCGRFETFPRQTVQVSDEYLKYLEKERSIIDAIPELQKMKVASLYIGGGTPTYLNVKQLDRLTKFLTATLDIQENAEFTVEGSPETIKQDKLEKLLENRVNRISMGVQSFHDDILKICGRRHNTERAKKAAHLIRKAGFTNFNIDLMSGLPYQSLERFEEDLKTAVDSGAACVTIYPLYIRPGCNMAEFDNSIFPNQEDSLLMQIMAKEFFKEIGYVECPVHFFALPGIVSQAQNINKWGGAEAIGLGVSTYQFMNNTQYHNLFDMEKYKASIDSGELPIWIGKHLDTKEQMARLMVLGMKKGQVDKKVFSSKFGVNPEEVYPEIIEILKELGLIEITDTEIRLTYLGELYSEEVAIQFFTEETRKAVGNKGYAGYSLAELPKL